MVGGVSVAVGVVAVAGWLGVGGWEWVRLEYVGGVGGWASGVMVV